MQTNTIEALKPPQMEALRQQDDAATWAAEVLNGNMRTSFEFTFDGHELHGHDGLPLSPVFDNAITDAERTARQDPGLAFQVRRCNVERDELDDIFSMVRDEAPNTMVVVSDFPEELMDSDKDVGGYNVTRKQTMLRIISKRPDGSIQTISQSLEGSSRAALEAIYDSLGTQPEDGELLGQRIFLDMSPEDQEFLADNLTGVYDRKLSQQYGGNWRAGWEVPTERAHVNTYDFVLKQEDLIEAFINSSQRDSDGLYGFAAAMKKRYEWEIATSRLPDSVAPAINFMADPMIEMYQAAVEAKSRGEVFSGCGASVGRNGELSTEESLRDLGYGDKTDEDKYGSLTFKCPKGHTNRRPRDKLIPNCQKCGVDVRC